MSGWRRGMGGLAAVVPPLVLLGVLAHHYHPFIADDALISLRYADRLLHGKGLTWTDGEWVEGYSNFLWVLAVAVPGALGLDLIVAARALGLLCMVAVCFGVLRGFSRTPCGSLTATLSLAPVMATGPVAVWSIGGLEQPMCAAFLAWGVVEVWRLIEQERSTPSAAVLAGAPFAGLCLTRPDGPLFVAVAAAYVLVHHRLSRRGRALAAGLLALPIAAVLGHLAFRWVTYGEWVPNTAYLKARSSWARAEEGLAYVLRGACSLWPMLVLLLPLPMACWRSPRSRARAALVVAMLLAWLAYIVLVGGDIFPAYRHLVQAIVLGGFLVGVGLQPLLRRRRARAPVVVVVTALVGILWRVQLGDPENLRAMAERWEWDGQVLGEHLKQGFQRERPYTAVTAAGTIPYFSSLPSLDMLGLSDRHIARRTPVQSERLGHDHGDGQYVLDRQPDLIIFHLGDPTPLFVSGVEMQDDPRFVRDYQLVTFVAHHPHYLASALRVRRGGRVGVKRTATDVTVPAYLLKGGAVGHRLGSAMAARIPRGAVTTLGPLQLERGAWRVELDPPPPRWGREPWGLRWTRPDGQDLSIDDAGRLLLPKKTAVTLELRAPPFESILGSVRLVREAQTRLSDRNPARSGATVAVVERDEEPWPWEPLEQLATFDGGHDGWVFEGAAFRRQPASFTRSANRGVTGHRGGLIDTYARRRSDRATGHARSPVFRLDAPAVLRMRIGGGADARHVGVALLVGEERVMTWTGGRSPHLDERRFDLTPYVGQALRLEIYDHSEAAWGHILVDEIELVVPGR